MKAVSSNFQVVLAKAMIVALGLCICLPGLLFAQALPLRTVTSMPLIASESSGLIYTGPNRLWTHNDSGGEPKLYQMDTLGNLLRTVVVRGVLNGDWEELTQDADGNVYVGDFGNNFNDRTNLVILKLPPLDSLVGDTVTPMRIDFSYPDQFAFPPADSLKNFDMEAFVALGDSLYLFSKNRTVPFDGLTKLYRLPQTPGTFVAELIDSFYAGPGPTLNDWICGAALNPAGDRLFLLSYAHCWIFSCFEGADFFGGAVVERDWPFTQKEAAAWRDSARLFISDELVNQTVGGILYEADMSAFLLAPDAALGPDTVHVGDTLWLSAPSNPGGSFWWSTGATTATIAITQAGTYVLQVTAANGCSSSDTITVDLIVATSPYLPKRLNISASPNPFTGQTQIRFQSNGEDIFAWRLVDAVGREVAHGGGETFQGMWQIEIGTGLEAGLYHFVMESGTRRGSVALLRL